LLIAPREKKLSMDYSRLFEICGVTGDTLLEMRDYGRDEWKDMKDELESEHKEEGVVPVKLADRAKIKHVRRCVYVVCMLSSGL
jgi:hypothetical protein